VSAEPITIIIGTPAAVLLLVTPLVEGLFEGRHEEKAHRDHKVAESLPEDQREDGGAQLFIQEQGDENSDLGR
jgi:hypothetical protein